MSNTNVLRLSADNMPRLRAWVEAKATKKRADVDGRKADGVLKGLRPTLFTALCGADYATCGKATITTKAERRNPDALTLKNGRSILLRDLAQIVAANGDVIDVPRLKRGSVAR